MQLHALSAAVQLMQINSNEYRKKVFSCFVGKSIGGTLGMKYEGDLNYNNVTYYDPVPDLMLPNDDLDLQVVNLETLIRTGFPVCRYNISEIWKYHLDDSAPDEYGAAISNHRNKIFSPLSGIYRNKFTEGLGGAIRSEIWACIAPGNPSLAAKLAKEDACTDHDENGIYAEMFLAAFESLAFVESDIRKITELALKEIPVGCKLKAALTDTIKWVGQADDLLSVRANILEHYPSDNWTDVCINLPFMLLTLYSADGDFDKAICTAASLGYDGDCTTATVGAIMGIIAPDSMTEKWTAPIGKDLVLTTCILNMHEAASIDDFCKKIVSIAYDAQTFYRTDIQFSDELPISERTVLPKPWSENFNEVFNWEIGEKTSLIAIRPFLISLTYPETVSAVPGQECKLTLKLCNTSKVPMKGKVSFRLLDGWKITCPQPEFDLAVGESTEIPFRLFISVPRRRVNLNLLSIDLEANGVISTLEAGIPLTKRWR